MRAATKPSAPRSATYRRPWLAQYQTDALFCAERYSLIEASTKSGKTAGSLIWLFEQAIQLAEGRSVWWVAPIYPQTEIAFRRMKRGIPREIFTANNQDRYLTLANGAMIWFKSGERPDSLYGEDVYAAVVDEASRLRAESWYALRSTLTATNGRARIVGNVKGRFNWFYQMARKAERGTPGYHYAKITAADAVKAGIIKAEEVEDAKQNLPPQVFEELYNAAPSDIEGRMYKCFGPENVSLEAVDAGGPLLVGMDFNVNPMSAVLSSRVTDTLQCWGEIVLRNSNTQEMASEIKRRYPDRHVVVYPDPSGVARKSSAEFGVTDFSILRSKGFSVVADSGAHPVIDSVNEVNALCLNEAGNRRLFVHPTCTNLLESLDGMVWKEGTMQPDKSLGIDHMGDCLRYLVHQEFPMVMRPQASTMSSLSILGV